MTPTEFWHHATAAREGMIETAIKTAKCGYTMRKMVKCLENLVVQIDGSVRSISTGSVVQMTYGEDGINPAKVIMRDGKETHAAGNPYAESGDPMGILAAQSIGERLTQLTLDTFHSTGLAQDHGLVRVQNILGGYSASGERCIGIQEPYLHVKFYVRDLCVSVSKECRPVTACEADQAWLAGKPVIGAPPACVLNLDPQKMTAAGLTPWKLAANLMHQYSHCTATYTANKVCVYGMDVHNDLTTGSTWASLGLGAAGGGVPADSMPPIDLQMYSSNAKHTAELLGIEAARLCVLKDLCECMGNVNIRHIMLIADAITHHGELASLSRSYVRKHDPTAVLGMASFETVCEVMGSAAREKIVDPVTSVSSCIAMGQMPTVGTNSFDVVELYNFASAARPHASDITALLNKPVSRKRSFSQLIGGI